MSAIRVPAASMASPVDIGDTNDGVTDSGHGLKSLTTATSSLTISHLSPPITHFKTPAKPLHPIYTINSNDGDYDDEEALYYPELSADEDSAVQVSSTSISGHRPPPPPPSSRHQKLFCENDEDVVAGEDWVEVDDEVGVGERDKETESVGGLYRRLTDEGDVDDNEEYATTNVRSPSLSSALSRVEEDPTNLALTRLMDASMAAAQVQAAAVHAAAQITSGTDHYDAARLPQPPRFRPARDGSGTLKKLSVDLIKTYKQINEVSFIPVSCFFLNI